MIRTAAGNFPPTQVYDVYALAIENVPGWWVYMANLIPFVQNAVQNVQARNPGLELRVHWITELSYGRDMQYRPADQQRRRFAASRSTTSTSIRARCRRPRRSSYYYPPDNFKRPHPGRQHRHERLRRHDESRIRTRSPTCTTTRCAIRTSWRSSTQRVAERPGDRRRADAPDPPRAALPEPDQYRNAIFINLHGELFPFPPVRNYSDAGEGPGELSGTSAS